MKKNKEGNLIQLKIMLGKAAKKEKQTFSENYRKKNVSTTLSNVKDTIKLRFFLVEDILEINYEYEDEDLPRHSEAV